MDEKFMKRALLCAKKAESLGEVPVGAVITRNGQFVSSGYNRREIGKNALLHAEITAINRACKKLGGWRLHECEMYVTLEPCPMCAGAIINSRIKTVYIGAKDLKAGSFGSICDLSQMPYNHKPEIIFGILEEESRAELKQFFKELRKKSKKQ